MPDTTPQLPSALAVARYILRLGEHDEIEDIDQLKIQKLLYLCQCWSLARRGRQMFPEEVEAWVHGPAVPSVYAEYRGWGREPIALRLHPEEPELAEEDMAFVECVWEDYKHLSGIALRNLTHGPGPWKTTRGDLSATESSQEPIPEDLMRDFFADQLKRKRRG